jgi:hypothetical protein
LSLESGCTFSGLFAGRPPVSPPECALGPTLTGPLSALTRPDEFASAARNVMPDGIADSAGRTGAVAAVLSVESGCTFPGLFAGRPPVSPPECALGPTLTGLLSALTRPDEFASAARNVMPDGIADAEIGMAAVEVVVDEAAIRTLVILHVACQQCARRRPRHVLHKPRNANEFRDTLLSHPRDAASNSARVAVRTGQGLPTQSQVQQRKSVHLGSEESRGSRGTHR